MSPKAKLNKGIKLDIPEPSATSNPKSKGCAILGGLGAVGVICVLITVIGLLVAIAKFVIPIIILLVMMLSGGKIGG